MAAPVTAGSVRMSVWNVVAVLGVTIPSGYLVAYVAVPITRNRYFPWIVGRTLGLAAYAALVALVALGIWVRHPWRHRWPVIHPEARLRLHATLGIATCVLLGGHVAALAMDKYAGVPWPGTLVPDASTYRPIAVTIGVLAFYFMFAITLSAGLGGKLMSKHWLIIHRLATPTFIMVWLHAVLAGSDTPRLRIVYALSGGFTALLMLTRMMAKPGHVAGRDVNPDTMVTSAPAGSGAVPTTVPAPRQPVATR